MFFKNKPQTLTLASKGDTPGYGGLPGLLLFDTAIN